VQQADVLVLGGLIVTMDRQRTVLIDGAIAVRDGVIVAVGPRDMVGAEHHATRVIEAADALIIPGLIDAHTHMPMTLFRGLADDLPLHTRRPLPDAPSRQPRSGGRTAGRRALRLGRRRGDRAARRRRCRRGAQPAQQPEALGSGIAPVPDLLRAGIRLGLGTDGAASNNELDLFAEIQMAALIHKGVRLDPLAVPAAVALEMATIGGARARVAARASRRVARGREAR
jgi:cytosine/adenosine deaminase-related metal-dependent hydrolase